MRKKTKFVNNLNNPVKPEQRQSISVSNSRSDHTNCSVSVHLRQLVISSFPLIHHCDECWWSPFRAYVWKSVFKLATGFFVMGLTRSWWETPMVHWGRLKGERSRRGGGGVGAPTGALSHDDTVKQIPPGLLAAAHNFVSGHSLPCLLIQQNPFRALEAPQHV